MHPVHVFRRLPLFWKLLVPFAALLLIVGAFGAYVIVRDLNSRAQTTLNEDLLQASLEARGALQERELYLLESANLAANLDGMTEAVAAEDAGGVRRLLDTVLALKGDLDLVVVTDATGVGLVELRRPDRGTPDRSSGTSFQSHGFVDQVLSTADDVRQSGFLRVDGGHALAIAAPVCSQVQPCDPVGAALVALDLDTITTTAGGGDERGIAAAGVSLFGQDGQLLSANADAPRRNTDATLPHGRLLRRTEQVDGVEVHTLYAPFSAQGEQVGLVAVSLPAEPVFAAVRRAAFRLTVVVLAALVGIVAIGALLSRAILRQVQPVLEANRALGAGDLSVRAPVVSGDEIGELAEGLNQMADQLEASYDTLESRVAQRTAEVERLLQERTEFFASLSHELRTPLAVILSETDLLLDDPDDSTVAGQAIRQSACHLLGVVNDILEVARAEAGRLELTTEPVDLGDVVEGLRPTIVGLARGADLGVEIDVPSDLPEVQADADKLRDVVLNLVDNGVKYNVDGGSITVGAHAADDAVKLSVSDTGVGIAEPDQTRLFEPFARVAGRQPRSGRASTGLGLALCRRYVEAMSGSIDLESTVGEGTTVTVCLPVATGNDAPLRTRGRPARSTGAPVDPTHPDAHEHDLSTQRPHT